MASHARLLALAVLVATARGDYEKLPRDQVGREFQGMQPALRNGIKADALVVLLLPFAALAIGLAVARVTGASRVPAALGLLAVPLVARIWVMQLCYVRALSEDVERDVDLWILFRSIPPGVRVQCFLGSLEAYDGFSDGLALADAMLLPWQLSVQWCSSWTGITAFLAPVFCFIGLPGAMAVTLLNSTAAQFRLLDLGWHCEAELAGMSLLAHFIVVNRRDDAEKVLVVGLRRNFFESVPQLFLQTGLLMLNGGGLAGNPMIAVSVAFSLFSLGKKSLEMCQAAFFLIFREDFRGPKAIAFIVNSFCVILAFVYMGVRVVMLQICPGHAWTLSTGCGSFALGK